MSDGFVHTTAALGTVISIRAVGYGSDPRQVEERTAAIGRAVGWFHHVEQCCSRFDARSELRQLCARVGIPVPVSATLYEAVHFALAVAEETGGAFDPTVGHAMERRGFDTDFRTGAIASGEEMTAAATFRDVILDPAARTIALARPLLLDLGAVAKGLAIDMAARELRTLRNFAIDAGGDLYLGGSSDRNEPWRVGIRHPRAANELLEILQVTDTAVCTSGDYERRAAAPGTRQSGHHIVDARRGDTATAAVSVTVLSESAMVADALATAAFVLGPDEGLHLLAKHGAEGMIVSPALARVDTAGMSRFVAREREAAIVAG